MNSELIEKPTTVEVIAVSGKFIDNNKKNSQTKHSGPYSKAARAKRRQEVYKLYIEQNYPKTVIAKWKGVNKNTITSDIRFIERELAKEYDIHSLPDLFRKYKHRLELQIASYYEELKNEKDFYKKRILEKRITFDVDGKPPKKNTADSIWSENSKQAELIFNLREKALESSIKAGLSDYFHGAVKLELAVYAPNILKRKDASDYVGDLDACVAGVFDSLQPAPKNSTLIIHPMFNNRKDIGPDVPLLVGDDAQIVTIIAKKRENDRTFYTVSIESEIM